MALLFADGFDDGSADWAISGTTAFGAGYGRSGASGATVASSGAYLTRSIPASATVIFGFAFRTSTMAGYSAGIATSGGLCQLLGDNGATAHVSLGLTSSGQLYVARNPGTPTQIGPNTASGVIAINTWYYLEVQSTLDDAVGTFIVKVDGSTVINGTGLDTRNAGTVAQYDRVRFHVGNASASHYYDDVYILDSTGTANNNFLGDLVVEHIRPSGNDTSQFVGSDGNSTDNYLLVNEAGAAVTTSYVGSATVGNRDFYQMPGSIRSTGTIHGMYIDSSMAKSDSGAKSAAVCIKEGVAGTPRTGTSQALTTGYLKYGQAYDRKADGSAWTFADLQNLRIGAEVTA